MWGGREDGPLGQPGKKTAQVKTTTQRYFSKDSMLNHSTCNRFFFLLCNSLGGLPGGALGPHAGSAGVAQVRAEVRVTHTSNSNTGSCGSVHHPCHLSALRVSSQRLWLGGPARDPGFPVLALRQGLIQSSFHFCRNKNTTPMEPDTAISVAIDNLDNFRRQQLLGDLYFQTKLRSPRSCCRLKLSKLSLVSLVWSWHLFRRICLTSGNRGTAGVGDSVVLRRSWDMTKICMVVYRATAGGAVLAVLLSSSQDVLQPSAMVERSPCSFCNLKMI